MDDFTRECLDIAVDLGISGAYVARVLAQIGQLRGLPKAIRTEQGSLPVLGLCVRRRFEAVDAGRPTQNAYIERFNGKFRDECLNDHYFNNLGHAQAVIAE